MRQEGPLVGADMVVCPACSKVCSFRQIVEQRGRIACRACSLV